MDHDLKHVFQYVNSTKNATSINHNKKAKIFLGLYRLCSNIKF